MSKYLVDIDGKKVAYTIKEEVSFEEAVTAYQRIVDSAFHITEDEYGTPITAYAPHLVGLARDYVVVALFTDLDLADKENNEIWKLVKYSDVLANIMADEHRCDIVHQIYAWADEYINDYKTRVLANASRDELFAALKSAMAPEEDAFDGKSLRSIADKINNMSEEDILQAIIKASKE